MFINITGMSMGIRVGILTGGGDTPPLNAMLCGIVRTIEEANGSVVGFMRGWAGVLNPDREDVLAATGEYIEKLESSKINPMQGGTVLKSSRTNLVKVDGGLEEAVRNINKMCDALIAIGGDDTITVGSKIMQLLEKPINGVTKTVDNDVGKNAPEGEVDYGEIVNYFTPGFITAAVTGATMAYDLKTTSSSHERFMFLEAMGRKAGWLALGHHFANPDLIIIPECAPDKEHFIERAIEIYRNQGYLVGVIAESATEWKDGTPIEPEEEKDLVAVDAFGRIDHQFGHEKFGGIAKTLAKVLEEEVPKRGVTPQYFNGLVPEYLYRSGAPTKQDAEYATALGRRAAELTLQGLSGQMAVLKREGDRLVVDNLPLDQVVDFEDGKIKQRRVDPRFYDTETLNITEAGREYFSPIKLEFPEFRV